jgi:hypothetical protein
MSSKPRAPPTQRTAASGKLGFSRRHPGFLPMLIATGELAGGAVRVLWAEREPAGYAATRVIDGTLTVKNLLLVERVDAAEAVSVLAQGASTDYLRVRADQPAISAHLGRVGYPSCRTDWSALMIKPLIPGPSLQEARRALGLATERFMVSDMDIT